MKPHRGFEISELSLFRGKCENEVNYLNDKILYWNEVLEKYINPAEWKIKIELTKVLIILLVVKYWTELVPKFWNDLVNLAFFLG